MLKRQRRKVHQAVTPSLEEDEEIKAVFIGQTPIPPITYLLIGPIVFVFILKFKTIVATDRNLYVFPHKWMRTYQYSGDPYKVPIGRAKYASGSMYAQVDDGPKLWVMPFGPVKRALNELTAAMQGLQAGAQPAGQVEAEAAGSAEPQVEAEAGAGPAGSQPEGGSPAGSAGSS
jgi:hypothetical protein